MEDRRVFERKSVNFPLRFLDPASGKEGRAETVDISADGLGLVTKEDLSVRAPLEMWLFIPDKHAPLYTRGEVIWSQDLADTTGQRVGVRLEKADLMDLGRALRVGRRT
jgi:hypothetical protein